MRIGLTRIHQPRIEFVDDDGDAVLCGKFRDTRGLSGRVDHASRVVRVRKEEGPDARLEDAFEVIEIETGAVGMTEVVDRHGDDLRPEKLDELAIRKVVGPDDGDAVAGSDGRTDGEKQRTLRARRDDQLALR